MLERRKTPWRVALVTVTFNSGHVLADFLNSLDGQSNRDWELVVVDNASNDDTLDQLNSWQGPLHLIKNVENLGFAVATNQGISFAQSGNFDAVMLLNNDTQFDPEVMDQLFNYQLSTGVPLLSPAITYADEPGRFWFADGGFTNLRGGTQAWMGEKLRAGEAWQADFAPGCALLVKMDVFERIGVLDERFFVYWEDVDFCMRCRDAGLTVTVLAKPNIAHKVSALTGGASPFSTRMYHRNQILFLRKHFGALGAWLQTPALVAKIIARAVVRRDDSATTVLRLRSTFAALTER